MKTVDLLIDDKLDKVQINFDQDGFGFENVKSFGLFLSNMLGVEQLQLIQRQENGDEYVCCIDMDTVNDCVADEMAVSMVKVWDAEEYECEE